MARLILMGVGLCFVGVGIAIGTVFFQQWIVLREWALTVLAISALAGIPLSLLVFGISLFAGGWLHKMEAPPNAKKVNREKEEITENPFIEITPK